MKATDLLKRQHKEVKSLFKKLERAQDTRSRRDLLAQIAADLEAHTAIEEEIFYPAVAQMGTRKAEEMVAEAFEEHHVVKLVLAEVPKLDPTDDRFEAKMTVLSELVLHHADEEEKEMFKAAQRLGADELDDLGERMKGRFEEVRGRHQAKAA
jgi:hemerythrin superfamily protein